ncbi:MAG TPA: zinc-dependent metalloprotease family protein, partial [Candidatus Sumerlaeota bacterium]|nr:zinc-dependent metalloprotease family protein [Candidatus Sumerlaeota bacterium]
PAARDATGGEDAMLAVIDEAIDETNMIYKNSQINARVRLVYSALVNYVEWDDHQELNGIYDGSDGFLDHVHTWRDNSGADLVVTMNNSGGGVGVCPYVTFNAKDGYSIMGWDRAIGDYTFAHETGHNYGCCHAVGDSWNGTPPGEPRDPVLTYRYGYNFVKGTIFYHSIMAYPYPYNSLVTTPGLTASLQPYYSNPNVLVNGEPMGKPVGDANQAYNAKWMNDTAPTIAAYRGTKVTLQPPQNLNATNTVPLEVTITWDASSNAVPGSTRYRVYRADGVADTPFVLSDWILAFEFTDTTAVVGKTYYYYAKAAINDNGDFQSDFSAADTGSADNLPKPGAPDASDGLSGHVEITWDPLVPPATHVRVCRAEASDDDATYLSGWLSGTTDYYRDTTAIPGKTYYYRIMVAANA